ncbi:MAG: DEAD/DEAH box helicase [Actinobacteria bacterium]|nr:DEAD/DEAH box helicase [Actinomycetota bacterium]
MSVYDDVDMLLDVLSSLPRPPTLGELTDAVNAFLGVEHIDTRFVTNRIASSGDRLQLVDGVVRAETPTVAGRSLDEACAAGGLRIVVVDFETVPVHDGSGQLRRVPLQAGALRAGPDTAWVAGHAPLERLVRVEAGTPTGVRGHRLLEAARQPDVPPPGQVGHELAGLLDGADVVVAHNAAEVDLPVLEELLALADETLAPSVGVDSLYLAHALLPDRSRIVRNGQEYPAHALQSVAWRLGIERDQTHTALDDCRLLLDVLEQLAARFVARPETDQAVWAALTRSSPAWRTLLALASRDELAVPTDAATARSHLETMLASLPARRASGSRNTDDPGTDQAAGDPLEARAPHDRRSSDDEVTRSPADGPHPIVVDASWRGSDGRVDPLRLAQRLAARRGGIARHRPAQQQAAAHVATAIDRRTDMLIEAPTGSGKSLVLLAAALDWVSADTSRRAVISTFTRALQGQLIADLELLLDPEGDTASVVAQIDVVKGAMNRLSLRALVNTAAGLSTDRPERHGMTRARAADVRFVELVAYLLARLAGLDAHARLAARHTAYSVDAADLPGVFERWGEGRLAGQLAHLSQARNGDYPAGSGQPLAHATRRVAEALAASRIVVSNHAMLCSSTAALAELADSSELLLLADEAHELEAAATSTLTATVSTPELEELAGQLEVFASQLEATYPAELREQAQTELDQADVARAARAAGEGGELPQLSDAAQAYQPVRAARSLHDQLATQQLALTLGEVLGVRPGSDPRDRDDRAGVIADRDLDLGQLDNAHRIDVAFARLTGTVAAALAGVHPALARLNDDRRERHASLPVQLADMFRNLSTISADLRQLTDHLRGHDDPDPDPALIADAAATADTLLDERDPDPTFPEQGAADAASGDGTAAAPAEADDVELEDRLVWARELPLTGHALTRFIDERMQLRYWPVEVASTPVEVATDRRFRRFRAAFTVSVFVSGTLQVPAADDRWAYTRRQLGLDTSVPGHVIDTDFDPARQARLVAFADAPTWGEQHQAAVATIAHQLRRYLDEVVDDHGRFGAMVLTTSRADALTIAEQTAALATDTSRAALHAAAIDGNPQALAAFSEHGGALIGTRGLWQGVDVPADRLRLVWINKLPFAPFGDPVTATRLRRAEQRAAAAGSTDPTLDARDELYFPPAVMALRQAAGRLLRSAEHRGVIVISDPKLGGDTALARRYRRLFLGALPGYATDDGEGPGSGNVTTSEDGWARIWQFLATAGEDAESSPPAISSARADQLCQPEALREQALLPHTRRIRDAAYNDDAQAAAELARDDGLARFEERCREVAGALRLSDGPLDELRDAQGDGICAVAQGRDLLALLPTGYGKSFLFQLPGLVLPGVTLVVSPLVSLMTDQATRLNRTAGGAVRALTGPMRESNSRAGKAQVHEQLLGVHDHGIKLVYLAPERLASTRFQQLVRRGVEAGTVRRIAFDEAHTLADWGDTFRTEMRRCEVFIRQLRTRMPGRLQLTALTATATRTVRRHLDRALFDAEHAPVIVAENPIRHDIAVYKRLLSAPRRDAQQVAAVLTQQLLAVVDGHAIVYATTIAEVEELHAYLRAHLGRRRRVLMYHGRMPELEKKSVSEFFQAAPRRDDPEFEPMVVVATKAFGLGIDREDVRLVVLASPPGDLSEVYQALGRAGRGQAADAAADVSEHSVGVALLSARSYNTLQFFNRHEPDHERLVNQVLSRLRSAGSPLDTAAFAEQLLTDRLEAGHLAARAVNTDSRRARAVESYQALAVRAFAALVDAGVLEDRGNAPAEVTITAGEQLERHTGSDAITDLEDAAALAAAVVGQLDPDEQRRGIDLEVLHARLEHHEVMAAQRIEGIAQLWFELLQLQTSGWLDVKEISASNTRRQLLHFTATGRAATVDLVAELARGARQRAEDLVTLKDWFADDRRCANAGLADYFDYADYDRGACEHRLTRCSVCFTVPPNDAVPWPHPLQVLNTSETQLQQASAAVRRALRSRTGAQVLSLLTDAGMPLGVPKLLAALNGHARTEYNQRVPSQAKRAAAFGSMPSLKQPELEQVVASLVGEGRLLPMRWDGRQAAVVDPADANMYGAAPDEPATLAGGGEMSGG